MSEGRSLSVASGIASRGTRKLLHNIPVGLPPILIPLFMFAAFNGALSALSDVPGYKYYSFSAFQFVFVLYMSAVFTGAFSAIEIGIDYGGGMGNRLMLAAPYRMAIVGGYVIYAIGRFAVAAAVVWAVALLTGMPVRGGTLDVVGLNVLALLLCLAATLYGAGVALRLQVAAAGTLILIPMFMVLFLSPVFVPRSQLTGWLKTAASINPLTPPMEAGRGFLANDPVSVVLAFATTVGLVIAFGIWAWRGMKKAERGPTRAGGPRRRRRRRG
jgi:ABC-2 type transport system permease protein